jgi:peroxiredoxin
MGIDLGQYNGTADWELPVPVTYVIAPDAVIRLAFVNPDFMQRLEPAAIVRILADIERS